MPEPGEPATAPTVEQVEREGELPRERRIFVNRNLRMSAVELIGFDMDYTLAVYRQAEVQRLSVAQTLRKLIEKKGFPPEIAELSYDPSFAIRGLCVDTRHGNLFKMDSHGHVGRVHHGRRRLDREERHALYRTGMLRPRRPRFAWVDHLFALPEGAIFSRLVDYFDERGGADYGRIWDDIRECIDEAHRDDSIKSHVKGHPERFLERDPELAPTLHKFRSAGRRLFLLTNSLWDYTDALMSHLLDGQLAPYPSWRNYFDLVVVGAHKPHFFTGQSPFVELDAGGHEVGEARGPFLRGRVYQGGNLQAFEEKVGVRGDRILYVGDHIYGDMLRSKKSSAWRTALIVQELEDEIRVMDTLAAPFGRLVALEQARVRLESDLAYRQAALKALQRGNGAGGNGGNGTAAGAESAKRQAKAELDRARGELHAVLSEIEAIEAETDRAFNPHWGPLFKQGNENSMFGSQVEKYACVYTGRVSNFQRYSPVTYFRSPRAPMPHEIG
jgi:HAD superfamily 5'-nucleotidase-like hydrolase